MNWLISANPLMYDHASSFEHYGFIDWRQGNGKYKENDIVYIYCTKPIQKIQYKCIVERINLDSKEIRNDNQYWLDELEYYKSLDGKFMKLHLIDQVDNSRMSLDNLKQYGLRMAPQGRIKLSQPLLSYIESNFNDLNQNNVYPDMINEDLEIYEGIKKQITVNKYERNSIARRKCIEFKGLACGICKMTFFKVYGEIGKDFIHVHHKIPIHKIGKEYKIDYKEDLIPVCPNCHAMLHQKINGREIEIDELIALVSERNI